MKFPMKEFAIVALLVFFGSIASNFLAPSISSSGIVDPLASTVGVSLLATLVIALVIVLLKKPIEKQL